MKTGDFNFNISFPDDASIVERIQFVKDEWGETDSHAGKILLGYARRPDLVNKRNAEGPGPWTRWYATVDCGDGVPIQCFKVCQYKKKLFMNPFVKVITFLWAYTLSILMRAKIRQANYIKITIDTPTDIDVFDWVVLNGENPALFENKDEVK